MHVAPPAPKGPCRHETAALFVQLEPTDFGGLMHLRNVLGRLATTDSLLPMPADAAEIITLGQEA